MCRSAPYLSLIYFICGFFGAFFKCKMFITCQMQRNAIVFNISDHSHIPSVPNTPKSFSRSHSFHCALYICICSLILSEHWTHSMNVNAKSQFYAAGTILHHNCEETFALFYFWRFVKYNIPVTWNFHMDFYKNIHELMQHTHTYKGQLAIFAWATKILSAINHFWNLQRT